MADPTLLKLVLLIAAPIAAPIAAQERRREPPRLAPRAAVRRAPRRRSQESARGQESVRAQESHRCQNRDLAGRAAELRRKYGSLGFTVVTEAPFVVIGDEGDAAVRRWAESTIRWAVHRLRADFFDKDPDEVLDVWLFKDRASYEKNTLEIFGEEPTTPFGFYAATHQALIMNIATGGGTLVHEIVHPFVHANFPSCPAWFNEGLGSLFEHCGDHEGHIIGYTNWRLEGIQEAIRKKTLRSIESLLATTDDEFYGDDRGTNYAQARYLCYYLQQRGLLVKFYRAFRAAADTDPTGRRRCARCSPPMICAPSTASSSRTCGGSAIRERRRSRRARRASGRALGLGGAPARRRAASRPGRPAVKRAARARAAGRLRGLSIPNSWRSIECVVAVAEEIAPPAAFVGMGHHGVGGERDRVPRLDRPLSPIQILAERQGAEGRARKTSVRIADATLLKWQRIRRSPAGHCWYSSRFSIRLRSRARPATRSRSTSRRAHAPAPARATTRA